MARTGNGTTSYIQGINVPVPPASYTFHFLYKNATAAATGSPSRHQFCLLTAAYDVNFCWRHTDSTLFKSVIHRTSAGSYIPAQLTSTLLGNVQYSLGGTYDGANLRAWLNGVNEKTVSAAAANTGSPATPTALSHDSGSGFDDGTISEIGMWNTALTTPEMQTLALGVSPLLVRPSALFLYWPLVREAQGIIGGSLTVVGSPAVAVHPRVIYDDSHQIMRYEDVVDYASLSTSFSSGVSLASSMQPPPGFSSSIALASSFGLTETFARMQSRIALRSSFTSPGGDLASGRQREIC